MCMYNFFLCVYIFVDEVCEVQNGIEIQRQNRNYNM